MSTSMTLDKLASEWVNPNDQELTALFVADASAAISAAVQAERENQQPLIDALNKIIAIVERTDPQPVHPGTGEKLGRRPAAQQIIDVAAAVQAEREACAKVADATETECAYQLTHRAALPVEKQQRTAQMDISAQIAAAIRARGNGSK